MHPNRLPILYLLPVFIAVLHSCSASLPDDIDRAYTTLPDVIDYNFHVQPILSDRCYQCHGPDEGTRKAGLRLDIEQEAFARLSSGSRALVRGNALKSGAIQRCMSEDPEYRMPPPESKLSMTNREIAILAKWLDQGAEWKPHWSLIPINKPDLPDQDELAELASPVDHFVRQKLHDTGMEMNERADREHLLRRVSMDLTGLPPTLEEMDAFLTDDSPGAYEKVVDRLLESDAHAERLAMEWMDIARYSDSHGVSFDGARLSWPYRDWLIAALQQNMPYDSFLIRQIAGDLLDYPTKEDRIATAFYRMGQLEVSQGSIPEEFRQEYIAERTALTGTAFLGLTVECARCHDHKFDPITQKEFYQLSGFFNTTEEMGLGPTNEDRAPTMFIFREGQERTLDSLNRQIREQREQLRKTRDQVSAIEDLVDQIRTLPAMPEPVRIAAFDEIEKINKKRKKRNKEDKDEFDEIIVVDRDTMIEGKLDISLVEGHHGKAVFFDGEYEYVEMKECGEFELYEPFSVSSWIRTNRTQKGPTQTIIGNSGPYITDYRGWDLFLDSLCHPGVRLIHRLPDEYIEIRGTVPIKGNRWQHIGFTWDGTGTAEGLKLFVDGHEARVEVLKDKLERSIIPVSGYKFQPDTIPVRIGKGKRLWTFDVGMFDGAIDETAIYDTLLTPLQMASLGEQEDLAESREIRMLHAMVTHEETRGAMRGLRMTIAARKALLDTTMKLMVMEEMENPRKTFLLDRGLYNQPKEEVRPGGIESVLPYGSKFRKDRLGLARWITHPDNPLTARVAVNRYWQMLMGKGIVGTAEDFGIQGERPSHPGLLDWLAASFIESGWDVRELLKGIVLSDTYCQSSESTPEKFERDPQNKLYARGPSYRLPAEMIRDNALAASGLLVNKTGGPPVKPYQPEGLWLELDGTSFPLRKYEKDTLDGLYRRSMYTFSRRFAPHPFMRTFDASTREICKMRRDVTTSPLQALTLLNDPQIVEASRILAEKLIRMHDDLDKQIITGYRLATGTSPKEEEVAVLRDLHREALTRIQLDMSIADSLLTVGDLAYNPELDKKEIAALALVASTIFNSDPAYMKR